MSKKVNHAGQPPIEGMEKRNTIQKFIKFENENDYVKGFFLGTKQLTSKEYKQVQTSWIVEVIETNCTDYNGEIISEGDRILVPEKTTMENMRFELEQGMAFALVFAGEKKSKDGKRKFKDFDFYL